MCSKEVAEFIQKSKSIRARLRTGYILLIDDDYKVTNRFKKIANAYNLDVVTVNHYFHAIEKINKDVEHIKCIILDLHLNNSTDGELIVQKIEEERINVPYLVYSDDTDLINKVMYQYPRSTCLRKYNDFGDIFDILGLVG